VSVASPIAVSNTTNCQKRQPKRVKHSWMLGMPYEIRQLVVIRPH
jgi:hypothetical protein